MEYDIVIDNLVDCCFDKGLNEEQILCRIIQLMNQNLADSEDIDGINNILVGCGGGSVTEKDIDSIVESTENYKVELFNEVQRALFRRRLRKAN